MQLLNSNIPPSTQNTKYSNKKAQDLVDLVLFCFVAFSYYKDVCVTKIADFISRFDFSFFSFLAFSVPFSNHALRDFKEEISNNLLRSCILFRFPKSYFLRDK